jgi:hypothetical protein
MRVWVAVFFFCLVSRIHDARQGLHTIALHGREISDHACSACAPLLLAVSTSLGYNL